MNTYPIISNCNFESRDDARGKAIHAARLALEAGLSADSDLLDAMDSLEDTLAEHAESSDVDSVDACRAAEREVERAYLAVADAIESTR